MNTTLTRYGRGMRLVASLAIGVVVLSACERPPPTVVQRGYRGTGMQTVYNPRDFAKVIADNKVPDAQPPASPEGPRANQVFKNVQVLGDLSAGELARVMLSITQWVAPPDQSCAYCHTGEMSADDLYTKRVARRMLQMVRQINSKWTKHVAATGVTCYTCHHGQPVPALAWFSDPGPRPLGAFVATRGEQNIPAPLVGLTSLPYDPLNTFLVHPTEVRIGSDTPLPNGNRRSIKQAEFTYGLMMYMSGALGVNCTYCHNTHNFRDWETSPPQRVTAWYGIRMVRELNNDFMIPLTSTFPATRLGPMGDVGKVACATCHRGAYKPLFGAPMLKDYPELGPPRTTATAEPVAAPKTPAHAPAAKLTAAALATPGDQRVF